MKPLKIICAIDKYKERKKPVIIPERSFPWMNQNLKETCKQAELIRIATFDEYITKYLPKGAEHLIEVAEGTFVRIDFTKVGINSYRKLSEGDIIKAPLIEKITSKSKTPKHYGKNEMFSGAEECVKAIPIFTVNGCDYRFNLYYYFSSQKWVMKEINNNSYSICPFCKKIACGNQRCSFLSQNQIREDIFNQVVSSDWFELVFKSKKNKQRIKMALKNAFSFEVKDR